MSLIMFYLNMGGHGQGYMSLRLCVFFYVLLEHDGLPYDLPLVVHLE